MTLNLGGRPRWELSVYKPAHVLLAGERSHTDRISRPGAYRHRGESYRVNRDATRAETGLPGQYREYRSC